MSVSESKAPKGRPRTSLVLVLCLLGGLGCAGLVGLQEAPILAVERHRSSAERWGREYDIDANLILAVASVESGGDTRARSHAGARGLMQFLPATGQDMATRSGLSGFDETQLDDPEVSIRLGACYLDWLSERFGKDRPITILAAYNAGYGTVRRWLEADGATAGEQASDLDPASIEFEETRNYVVKVRSVWSTLRARSSH